MTHQPQSMEREFRVVVPEYFREDLIDYITKSERLNSNNIKDISSLKSYFKNNYDINIEINYFDGTDTDLGELEKKDFIAAFSLKEESPEAAIDNFFKMGQPFVFLKHKPEMLCERVFVDRKIRKCYKSYKDVNHCQGTGLCGNKYILEEDFIKKHKAIHTFKRNTRNDILPLFQVNFLIDFIIWYNLIGLKIRASRDLKIEKDTEQRTLNHYILSKSISQDFAQRINK